MKKTKIAGLAVLAIAMPSLGLTSCLFGSEGNGEEITQEEAKQIVSGYDYEFERYYLTTSAAYDISYSEGELSYEIEAVTTMEIGIDFSDDDDLYYGLKTLGTGTLLTKLTVEGKEIGSTTVESTYEYIENLNKQDDGSYLLAFNTLSVTTRDGETSKVEAPSTSTPDLSSEETRKQWSNGMIARYGFTYSTNSLAMEEIEDENTKFYLASDGSLTLEGSAETTPYTVFGIGSVEATVTYDYLMRFDNHGIMTRYEQYNYVSDSSSLSYSSSMLTNGSVNTIVSHTDYELTSKE